MLRHMAHPRYRIVEHLRAGTGPPGTIVVVSTGTLTTAPVETDRPSGSEVAVPDRPWIVIVWNDPINLMSYVTYVFQKLFGYSRDKATKLMLDVHRKGKAVVSSGTREKAEFDTYRLHAHGLWATMQHDS
jgi:ATP-dependent Clp protease adaptor protein ClpS